MQQREETGQSRSMRSQDRAGGDDAAVKGGDIAAVKGGGDDADVKGGGDDAAVKEEEMIMHVIGGAR